LKFATRWWSPVEASIVGKTAKSCSPKAFTGRIGECDWRTPFVSILLNLTARKAVLRLESRSPLLLLDISSSNLGILEKMSRHHFRCAFSFRSIANPSRNKRLLIGERWR
jgi:hypothetical protein